MEIRREVERKWAALESAPSCITGRMVSCVAEKHVDDAALSGTRLAEDNDVLASLWQARGCIVTSEGYTGGRTVGRWWRVRIGREILH
jgi:hypothetical protein